MNNSCFNCGVETPNPKFCSKFCSATYNRTGRKHTQETITKISNWAKNNPRGFICQKIRHPNSNLGRKRNENLYVNVICPTCNREFSTRKKQKRKFCSPDCVQTGGYREKSGRGKSGYYRGVYCASTYELCWVIFQLDHGNNVNRFPTFLQNDELKYYPDFILDDGVTLIEIKGYEDKDKLNKKISLAVDMGYKIKVLYKSDLKSCFEYINNKYNTTKIETLYDVRIR